VAVVASGPQGGGRPRKRSDIDAERRARHEATSREIDRLVGEAHARLPRHLAKVVGAIYVRFSTWMQFSIHSMNRHASELERIARVIGKNGNGGVADSTTVRQCLEMRSKSPADAG
jgi:hypothetical protein